MKYTFINSPVFAHEETHIETVPIQFAPRPQARMPIAIAGVAREDVLAFVEAFYSVTRSDPLIGPVFARIIPDAHWPAHFEMMTNFWMAVAFGGSSFRGDPMLKHARIKDLAPEHFERWLSIFTQVATQHWPEPTAELLIHRAQQIAPALLAGAHRARERQLVTPDELH